MLFFKQSPEPNSSSKRRTYDSERLKGRVGLGSVWKGVARDEGYCRVTVAYLDWRRRPLLFLGVERLYQQTVDRCCYEHLAREGGHLASRRNWTYQRRGRGRRRKSAEIMNYRGTYLFPRSKKRNKGLVRPQRVMMSEPSSASQMMVADGGAEARRPQRSSLDPGSA